MGGYFDLRPEERQRYDEQRQKDAENHAKRIADGRSRIAAKIVMTLVDRITREIIRPGPVAEERECYEMAGELRAIVPDLEQLTKDILDVNGGVK